MSTQLRIVALSPPDEDIGRLDCGDHARHGPRHLQVRLEADAATLASPAHHLADLHHDRHLRHHNHSLRSNLTGGRTHLRRPPTPATPQCGVPIAGACLSVGR